MDFKSCHLDLGFSHRFTIFFGEGEDGFAKNGTMLVQVADVADVDLMWGTGYWSSIDERERERQLLILVLIAIAISFTILTMYIIVIIIIIIMIIIITIITHTHMYIYIYIDSFSQDGRIQAVCPCQPWHRQTPGPRRCFWPPGPHAEMS